MAMVVDALEALVGYVFVVGGRAVSATPPGALVEQPPRKAQRSREGDTFFALISPAGGPQAQATFYEALARLAAETYFRSGGSVTNGLRESLSAINGQLIEQRMQASASCLVLRGSEVYLARAGVAICLLHTGTEFTAYPDDPADQAGVANLGSSATVDIRLSRFEVEPGHVMALGDAGLGRVDRDKSRDALGMGSLPDVIEPLKAHCGNVQIGSAQIMIIEFASHDTPNPVQSTPVASGKSVSKPVSKPASKPTSKPVSQPIAPQPEPDADSADDAGEIAPQPPTTPVPQAPLPRRLTNGIGGLFSGFARLLSRVLDRLMPESGETEDGVPVGPRIPAMFAAALAILVPVIVVFVVVAVRLSQADLTQFEQMVQQVEEAAQQAELISLEDVEAARKAWLGIIQRVELVETSAGRTNDPALMRIRGKAQGILDSFDKVTRRKLTAMRNYGADSKLIGPIIRSANDVYMLDAAAIAIYRDTLSPSLSTLLTRNTQPVIQQGQAVGAFSVRQLIDMVWMAEGGVQRVNVLTALDTQGILVSYSPTFSATAQRLSGVDLWGKPAAIATWKGNFYVLDPAENQIWRYRPVINSYPNPPDEYFPPDDKPDLANAVDMAISLSGDVYMLFGDGSMRKFNSGVLQRFSYVDLPLGDGPKSGAAMYLDDDSDRPALYVLDPVDESIWQFGLGGAFFARFRAAEPNAFRAMTGMYANRENIYVASGPMLYYFSIADTTTLP